MDAEAALDQLVNGQIVEAEYTEAGLLLVFADDARLLLISNGDCLDFESYQPGSTQ